MLGEKLNIPWHPFESTHAIRTLSIRFFFFFFQNKFSVEQILGEKSGRKSRAKFQSILEVQWSLLSCSARKSRQSMVDPQFHNIKFLSLSSSKYIKCSWHFKLTHFIRKTRQHCQVFHCALPAWFLVHKLVRLMSLLVNFHVQPGVVKLVLWRHWMHLSYMHPVTSENQFYFTRLNISLMYERSPNSQVSIVTGNSRISGRRFCELIKEYWIRSDHRAQGWNPLR